MQATHSPSASCRARSGVAPSALRYYERLGLIRAERTGGNQRRYARAELRRVAFIRIAQQVGVSLDEIRDALDSLPERAYARPRPTGRASRAPGGTGWTSRSRCSSKLRDDLDGCIGCGCLSLQRCSALQPRRRLAAEGPGPLLCPAPPPPPALACRRRPPTTRTWSTACGGLRVATPIGRRGSARVEVAG